MNTRKSTPKKVTDPQEASEMILNWFEKENKPVTVQFLTDALGSCTTKALVQKTLEDLSEQGKLRTKDLKKVRLFFLNMEAYRRRIYEFTGTKVEAPEINNGTELDAEYNLEKKRLVEDILRVSHLMHEKEQHLTQLKQSLVASQRKERLSFASDEVNALGKRLLEVKEEARLHATSSTDRDRTDDSVQRTVKRYQKARLLWKERKEYVERIVDGILGDECSAHELANTFGIISDAQAGVSLFQSAVHLH